jgi:ribonuclease HII
MKYVIGIDEVGRGPIAGPLVVCACAIMEGTDALSLFPKGILKDSKQLSEKNRLLIIEKLEPLLKDKKIMYGIGEIDAEEIDGQGLSISIKNAISEALKKVHGGGVEENSFIYLDGSLHADEKYEQETIIKGDEKIAEIALASIIGKVYRDTFMKKLAKEHPSYGFENHVGYGTKVHYEALQKHGLTRHHRKSFLKTLL